MADLKDIIKKNFDTHYDYNSGIKKSLFPTLAFQLLLAIFFAFSFGNFSDPSIGGLLGFYSILTGFSFSILFFLVSGNKFTYLEDAALENKNEVERLNKLRKELFFNVSYFSILSVFISLLLIVCFIKDIFSAQELISSFSKSENTYVAKSYSFATSLIKKLPIVFYTVLYFCLFNSLHSFYRIILRINYLFATKLKLENSDQTD